MTSFATVALLFLNVQALPQLAKRTQHIDDVVVLNYALTLEFLERAFYTEALEKFDDKAFTDAGLPSDVRGRFVEIRDHEKTHVEFLSTALGSKATCACNYTFPYTDPKSFSALSQILEGVGVSAYIGAAQFIENKDYLTAAASILSTEARHASYVASGVNGAAGWSGAFDVPLDFNQVYTLASAFITSCPSTNPKLPFAPFPTLVLGSGAPGSSVSVAFNSTKHTTSDPSLRIAFYTGLTQTSVPVIDGNVVIPANLTGQVYAVATTKVAKVNDKNIIAGPAILVFNH